MAQDGSTTVDRGIRVLFELAENPEGLSVSELARRLDTQRPPLYRQLRSLESARLIRRGEGKLYQLGIGILELAKAFNDPFNERARPALQAAADATDYSAMLVVSDGDALVVAIHATPTRPAVHLMTPVGYRMPEGMLPPRVATLSLRPYEPGEDPLVTRAREQGYVGTFTVPTERPPYGVAVALVLNGIPACVSMVSVAGEGLRTAAEEAELASFARTAAESILASHR
ncbi:helix-turn-helix domain-containing protein [Microbacterium immunditiarum]|uniref:HTH iclR-type domain-containing protein n=1 Tax=Microbacterium immunditiarum TaxID=337480 RepID=A0A7Y9GTV2_9MICO|nr:helix-turn-helix domain-containing protein [Microbacterium immunditiarum]NYE21530.1 hypothetical protein [Microbacterium immunditiarum]